MAHNLKKGDSVYIVFRDGEAVLDGRNCPRMYKCEAHFERNYPEYIDDKTELVEYAPVSENSISEAVGKKVYKISELVYMLQCSESTIRKYITSGRLAGQKVGDNWLVTGENLDKFLNGETTNNVKGSSDEYVIRIRDAAYALAVAARDDSNVKHIMHELLMIANHMEVMQRMGKRKDDE